MRPFLTMQFHAKASETITPRDILPQDLARIAVECFIARRTTVAPPAELSGVLAERAGAFVTLRHLSGALRGCIGTIDPTRENVAIEIVQNAISAATGDPRFPRVATDELADLTYGVDVLSPPEPVGGIQDLDPFHYGVIIEALDGTEAGRRGLLLPRIDGIDTADQQWRAVHMKARIEIGTRIRVERFNVRRFGKE